MTDNTKDPKIAKKVNIHAAHRSRMRSKFLKFGLDVFSDHEILELLLFYSLPQVDTNKIAHELINLAGGFNEVFDMPYEKMKTVRGISDQSATFLKLIPAVARYYAVGEAMEAASGRMSYEEIAQLAVASLIGATKEVLYGFFFDSKMRLISTNILGEGTYSGINVNVRSVTDKVIRAGAVNVVLAHNHPTVTLIPSSDDMDSTKRLLKLLAQFDVNLVEHFVVTGNKYLGIMKFDDNIKNNYES